MKRLSFLLLPVLMIAGCQPDAGATKTPEKPKVDGGTTTPPAEPAPPSVKREDIPAELKTEAYYHYGLDRETSPTMELSSPGGGSPQGAVKNELIAIENGVAKFKQSWTGGLSYLGVTELEVRADGVYATSLNDKKMEPAQLELPSELKAGKTWSAANKLAIEGATITSTEMKIIGPKKVKTKAGDFDSVAVSATVKGTRDGKPLNLSMLAYYVKGVGAVRVEMTVPGANSKPTTTVLQASEKP